MFGRQHARHRDRERADAERAGDLRWLWRNACASTALSPMIYTPSGATRAVPVIANVELGPPVALTVKMRPGQTAGDFVDAAPAIASAMGVAALQVVPLAPQWVQIVLAPAEPHGEAWRFGA